MAPRIALIVDHPLRDLPGTTLIAYRLVKAGAMCFLVPSNLRNRELFHIAPDFVLLNYLRPTNESLVIKLKQANIMVGVLDTEGGVYFDPKASEVMLSNDKGLGNNSERIFQIDSILSQNQHARESVSCYCVWSHFVGDYLVAGDWFREDQVVVTGTPRTDYLSEKWSEVTKRLSPYVQQYPSPFVLLIGTFPLSNPKFYSSDKEIEKMLNTFQLNKDELLNRQKTDENGLKKFCDLANFLATVLPEVTFIYRPHPFEDEAAYSTLLEKRPNLHLVKQGPIDGWLYRASAIVQRLGSSAVEAALLSVPVLVPKWIPNHYPIPVASDVSVSLDTKESLASTLKDALNGRFKQPPTLNANLERIIDKVYHKVDGQSHERVVQAILDSLKKQKEPVSQSKCLEFIYNGHMLGLGGMRRIKSALKQFMNRTKHLVSTTVSSEQTSWDKSEKRFSVEDVTKVLTEVLAVAGQPLDSIEVVNCHDHAGYFHGCPAGRSVMLRSVSLPDGR